jgi:tetratricopeptide (TPR) repeat protein
MLLIQSKLDTLNLKLIDDIIIYCFIILLFSSSLFAQNKTSISFADQLYQKDEYYRAVSEYNRYLFFEAKNSSDSGYCFLKIAKSYYKGEDYNSGISFIESTLSNFSIDANLTNNLNNYLGLNYLKLGSPKSAIICFKKNSNNPKSNLLIGAANLYLFNWRESIDKFKSLSGSANSKISFVSEELSLIAKEGMDFKTKSPALAGVLSGILPGGGYVYTKNYQTALSSFLINTLLLGTTYELHRNDLKFAGGTTFLLAFGWYVGNIYGSVNSAIRYNNSNRKKIIDDSLAEYEYLWID